MDKSLPGAADVEHVRRSIRYRLMLWCSRLIFGIAGVVFASIGLAVAGVIDAESAVTIAQASGAILLPLIVAYIPVSIALGAMVQRLARDEFGRNDWRINLFFSRIAMRDLFWLSQREIDSSRLASGVMQSDSAEVVAGMYGSRSYRKLVSRLRAGVFPTIALFLTFLVAIVIGIVPPKLGIFLVIAVWVVGVAVIATAWIQARRIFDEERSGEQGGGYVPKNATEIFVDAIYDVWRSERG